MSDEKYAAYLQGNHWKRRRKEALGYAGYTCQKCGRDDCELHVHHLTYERVGAELDTDLMVLCRNCHEKHHFFGMSLTNTPEEEARRLKRIRDNNTPDDDGAAEEDEFGEIVDDGGWLDGDQA